MRRTLILTALGAITLSIGHGVGATLASATPARPGPAVTTTMMANGNNGQMHDGTDMTQMMGSTGMNGMMDADDVNAMDTTIHAAKVDRMSADQLAACDSAHASMTNGQPPTVTSMPIADHAAHHQGQSREAPQSHDPLCDHRRDRHGGSRAERQRATRRRHRPHAAAVPAVDGRRDVVADAPTQRTRPA